MERGQKLGVKYLFPWVLAPLRVGLASVSVVTGRELGGVLIADQLARASVVCRGAAHPVVEGRTTPDLPGGLRTGVRGWCWWCENWKSRWREGGSSSKPCRIGNHAGFVSTGQSPKPQQSPPLLASFFFLGSSTKIMVWVVQYQNHGGWDWDTPFVVPPAAWDCLTLPSPSPSARLVLSRSISSVECRTDGSSPRCCSSCCSSDVGAAGVPVVIRPIPGPTTETTDTHVPASPYRRRMCYVCGTAWPRSMYRATRFPCAIPTTVEAMATSQKHYPPREGTGRKKHLARLPNVYLYPGKPRDSISTSTRERTGRYTTCPISTCPVCPPPSRCRLSSHVPLRREAARSSCVARVSCSSRRATDKWLLAFHRHCGMRHLLHGCLWRKQTTRFHAEYWVTHMGTSGALCL